MKKHFAGVHKIILLEWLQNNLICIPGHRTVLQCIYTSKMTKKINFLPQSQLQVDPLKILVLCHAKQEDEKNNQLLPITPIRSGQLIFEVMEKNKKFGRNHTFLYMQPSKIPGPQLSLIALDVGSLYIRTANLEVSQDITSKFVLLINPLNKYRVHEHIKVMCDCFRLILGIQIHTYPS